MQHLRKHAAFTTASALAAVALHEQRVISCATVHGRSMQPTFNAGCSSGEARDRILLDHVSPRLR
tara:strand:- start:1225 stop:1419 length:195 start_codon:yes stop_codon:yes gene_type:complete